MALKIRLQRRGRCHSPSYRIVVAESSSRRDGRFVEIVGHYTPRLKNFNMNFKINLNRINYWLSVGAKPTNTAMYLIRKTKRED